LEWRVATRTRVDSLPEGGLSSAGGAGHGQKPRIRMR
jgi:hypothetical protein